jgi:trimethylamine---corrinoid protein Co-methyltransferase
VTMAQPRLEILSGELIQRVLEEAFLLLDGIGVMVHLAEARRLLRDAGAQVDEASQVARIPEKIARSLLESAPHAFTLYGRDGEPAVHYGGNSVHFDPGSAGVHTLDPQTLEHRPSETKDLIRLVKVAEMLPEYAAQSTALVCSDVPNAIGDLYRLYLVLLYSRKPVVTGAFTTETIHAMFEMLAIYTGGRQALAEKPMAIFDVCPSPPLVWSKLGAQNLIDLARARVPAEIVSMPLAGVAAPVTLIGSIVQHAAECISGIAIHQLAGPGAPIVWGGAPAIFDMRQGTTPMGAVETAMIDAGYAQVGKSLGFPTHAYLGASDAKIVDAQSGLESGVSCLIGALAGINMISGAGMLDFLACASPEKLVVDAEAIGMAQRLLQGIGTPTESLAVALFEGIHFKGDFLKKKETRKLFAQEQRIPSAVIDRGSLRAWQDAGAPDTFARAKARTVELLRAYQRPEGDPGKEIALRDLVGRLAREVGMENLPE